MTREEERADDRREAWRLGTLAVVVAGGAVLNGTAGNVVGGVFAALLGVLAGVLGVFALLAWDMGRDP